jgi:hypothetical protein
MMNNLLAGELQSHGWKPYEYKGDFPKDAYVRDGVLIRLSLLKSNGMYYVSIQSMSKVDVRLVSFNEVLDVIKNGKWSK